MTDEQWACASLLAQVIDTAESVEGDLAPCGSGIKFTTTRSVLSGLDADVMTSLAVRGVAKRIRPEMEGDGTGRVSLTLLPYTQPIPSPPEPAKKKGKAKRAASSPSLPLDFGDL